MAFSAVPTLVFGSAFTSTATTLSIPLSAFPELTSAEADASTGDSRKIIYAMVEKFWSNYNSLAAADKPAKMTLTKSSGSLSNGGEIEVRYNVNFTLGGTLDVVSE